MSQSSNASSTDVFFTRIGLAAEFPVGLRVMAIDPALESLSILNDLLVQCNFTVLHEISAKNALKRVYDQNEECDIVVTELDNLDVDAYGFLEHMTKIAPVVVLSFLDDKRLIIKAVLAGAAEYILKPAALEVMKNIWQHVLRSRLANRGFYTWRNPNPNLNPNPNPNLNPNPNSNQLIEGGTDDQQTENDNFEWNFIYEEANEGVSNTDNDDSNIVKKTRVSWDVGLHQRFLTVVNQLGGPDVAKPKQILDRMNLPWLSRENVASHLQKYRLALKNRLKVQPIWMDSNNESIIIDNEATLFDGVGNEHMATISDGVENGQVTIVSNGIGNGQMTPITNGVRNEHMTTISSHGIGNEQMTTIFNGVGNGQMATISNGIGNRATISNGVRNGQMTPISNGVRNGSMTPMSNGVRNGQTTTVSNGVRSGQMTTIYHGVENEQMRTMYDEFGDHQMTSIFDEFENQPLATIYDEFGNEQRTPLSVGAENGQMTTLSDEEIAIMYSEIVNEMAGPFLPINNASNSSNVQATVPASASYPQYDYYNSLPARIDDQQYEFVYNITNHSFNHPAQSSQSRDPYQLVQQPPMAPGGNFNNNSRGCSRVDIPAPRR